MTAKTDYSFCLNKFEKLVVKSWKEIQYETDFSDVILACEDKQIQTHKIVLSACSPVLKNALKPKMKTAFLFLMIFIGLKKWKQHGIEL